MADQLAAIWKNRFQQVRDTKSSELNRDFYEIIQDLYINKLKRTMPSVMTYDGGPNGELFVNTGAPIHIGQHLLQGLLHLGRSKLSNFNEVARTLGYDQATDMFRITRNKLLAFPALSIPSTVNQQIRNRPPWSFTLSNMICKFDIPTVVLYEYLVSRKIKFPAMQNGEPTLSQIARIMRDLLDRAFGVILFENRCVVMRQPTVINMDDMHRLSSTRGPAFWMPAGRKIFAVNGVRITKTGKDISVSDLAQITQRRQCAATIEYIGWEKFAKMMGQNNKIDKSKWGTLHRWTLRHHSFLVVEVTNATPEKNGTYRKYYLPVDDQCRPLPNPLDPFARMGNPQQLTALNAIASTFGMTGQEYEIYIGSHS